MINQKGTKISNMVNYFYKLCINLFDYLIIILKEAENAIFTTEGIKNGITSL